MSKSLVLTMTPQLGLTSQNPSAYYWHPNGLELVDLTIRQIRTYLNRQKTLDFTIR